MSKPNCWRGEVTVGCPRPGAAATSPTTTPNTSPRTCLFMRIVLPVLAHLSPTPVRPAARLLGAVLLYVLAGLAATGCNTVNGDDDGPTAPTPIGPGTG